MIMTRKKFDGVEIGQKLLTTQLMTVYLIRPHTKGTDISGYGANLWARNSQNLKIQ